MVLLMDAVVVLLDYSHLVLTEVMMFFFGTFW